MGGIAESESLQVRGIAFGFAWGVAATGPK